jgi:nucleotide-binding universal stress UspA family protein
MLKRIMVALDGSRLAEQTLPYASALARAFDAEIVLLRVVEGAGPFARASDTFDWRMERAQAIAYLDAIKRRLNQEGVSVDVDVTAGGPCEEILEMARAREADLLVLASHGAGGLSEFRMASTAQKVAFAAEGSVLIVPARESVTEDRPFETVLVPVDCTPQSDWAVTLAARLARTEGADLVVAHFVQAPKLLSPHGTERERHIVDEIVALNRGAASTYMEALAQRLHYPDLSMRSLVEVADKVGPALEHRADAEANPLLVLSARGQSPADAGPNGALIAVMLANTGHPVLVLRQPSRASAIKPRWSSTTAPARTARAPLDAE